MILRRQSTLLFFALVCTGVIPWQHALADFPIALGAGDQTMPTISNNWIAWEDQQASRVRAQNRTTGIPFLVGPILSIGGSQGLPRLSGDTVLWQGNPGNKGTMFFDNLADANPYQKVFDQPVSQFTGDISGNLVVWQESSGNPFNGDLYGSYLGSNTKFPISTTGSVMPWPVTDGRFVIWREFDGVNHSSLYMKDLQTGSSSLFQFTGGEPEIDNGIAVFGVDTGIAVRNLLTSDASTIPTITPFSVAISGGLAVYSIISPGKSDYDLWGVYLQTGQKFLISDAPGDQLLPDVSGNFVVWADTRNGNYDIYGALVPEPGAVALLGVALLGGLFVRRRS